MGRCSISSYLALCSGSSYQRTMIQPFFARTPRCCASGSGWRRDLAARCCSGRSRRRACQDQVRRGTGRHDWRGSSCVALARLPFLQLAEAQLATQLDACEHLEETHDIGRQGERRGMRYRGTMLRRTTATGDETRADGGRDGTDVRWVMTPHDRTRRLPHQATGPQAARLDAHRRRLAYLWLA